MADGSMPPSIHPDPDLGTQVGRQADEGVFLLACEPDGAFLGIHEAE